MGYGSDLQRNEKKEILAQRRRGAVLQYVSVSVAQ